MKNLSLSGFQIKLIALVFMLIDHLHTYFGLAIPGLAWVHWLGRFVAPIFLYFLVEGFFKTSNRRRYFFRLLTGTGIMFALAVVKNLVAGTYIHPITGQFDPFLLVNGNNIFLTLTLFFLLFSLLEKWQSSNKVLVSLGVLGVTVLLLFAEGGIQLLPLGLVFYVTKNKPKPAALAIVLFSVLWLVKAVAGYVSYGHTIQTLYQYLAYDSQFMMWPAAFFILGYNGKRGGSGATWEGQLFYLFYPLHLALIYIINSFI